MLIICPFLIFQLIDFDIEVILLFDFTDVVPKERTITKNEIPLKLLSSVIVKTHVGSYLQDPY